MKLDKHEASRGLFVTAELLVQFAKMRTACILFDRCSVTHCICHCAFKFLLIECYVFCRGLLPIYHYQFLNGIRVDHHFKPDFKLCFSLSIKTKVNLSFGLILDFRV